ncbi:sensor domain-containing diguanylate cyclase [Saccharobesus litoralis]|nr:sensor domain-containing diguanylate cyclase [Saccharobesus litoralis]
MNSKNRALGLVSFILFIGFITVSTISYWSARQSLSEQIVSEVVPLTGISIYSKIKEKLMAPIHISSLMAQDTFVHDWVKNGEADPDKMQRYLREIKQRNGAITSFFVSDKTLNYYHPNGILRRVSANDPQDHWYFAVRQSQQDYIVNIDIDTRDLQSLTVFINYKVLDTHGEYLGAIGIGLSVHSVKQLLDSHNPHQQFFIFFTDKQGKAMLQGESPRPILSLTDIKGLSQPQAQTLLGAPNSTASFQQGTRTTHVNSRFIQELGWYLMISHTEQPWDNRIVRPLMVNLFIGLCISVLVIMVVFYTLRRYQSELERTAITDKLTNVANRHGFDMIIQQSKKQLRDKQPCSIILFDLDNFKQINDTYTHMAGDLVILDAVDVVRSVFGSTESLIRWGGEEFLLVLPGHDARKAQQLAERLRYKMAERISYFETQPIQFTASFGVAQWQTQESVNQLLYRVDKALYQAKQLGKDQVQVAGY